MGGGGRGPMGGAPTSPPAMAAQSMPAAMSVMQTQATLEAARSRTRTLLDAHAAAAAQQQQQGRPLSQLPLSSANEVAGIGRNDRDRYQREAAKRMQARPF